MPDKFPRKERGDPLSHDHVNALSDAARKIEGSRPGTFLHGHRGGSVHGNAGHPPWRQHVFRITSDEGDGLYKGVVRWYSHGDEEWKPTDAEAAAEGFDDKEWNLDASGLDQTLGEGNLIVSYWDAQRGMFVPIVSGVVYFELTGSLAAGSTTGATAHKRAFDSALNAGEGGYTTGTDEITVKDTREVGYEGSSGAKGACIMKSANNGAFGEIVDLECP